MPVREILHVGNPLLRERSREVTRDELASPEMQQLIDDLIDTMHAANGAGIAAPQVGELVRIATIEVTENPRYPYKPRIPLTIVVNPVIEPLSAGSLAPISKGAYHSTFNTGWEPMRILVVYAPAGPEQHMRESAEFQVLTAGRVAMRPGHKW